MIRHCSWLFAHVAIAALTKIMPLDFRQPEECSADARSAQVDSLYDGRQNTPKVVDNIRLRSDIPFPFRS